MHTEEFYSAKKTYEMKVPFVKKLLGYCPWCCRYFKYGIKFHRRGSQYIDERNNWMTGCKECRDNDDEYFADLWEQFHSGLL